MPMFGACNSLSTIKLPGTLKHIGNSAFSQCYQLDKFILPDSLQSLGRSVFMGTLWIRSSEKNNMVISNNGFLIKYTGKDSEFTIPDNVRYIASYVFSNNQYLECIVFSDNIKVIAQNTFSNCSMLKDIVFPKNLEIIEANAFYNGMNLVQINLPKSLVSIGDSYSKC